jgi:hypothetical protein
MRYRVFKRAWYKPDGETPHPNAKKTMIKRDLSREEARALCDSYNLGDQRTADQIRVGIKYELEPDV